MWIALLRSMRPRQWTKNAFVFAALVFDLQLVRIDSVLRALAGFTLLCLASSAVYLVNDLADLEADRQHPTKRLRPLASGALSPAGAAVAAAALAAVVLLGSFALGFAFGAIVLGYVLLNLLYSFRLKHIPILDVLIVAAGFVLRVGAGVSLVVVERFSPWLYVCTTLLALFLAFGKRRAEIVLLEGTAGAHRRVLEGYTVPLLDHLLSIVSATTIVAYSLYTFSAENLPGNHLMMLTIPFVLYGIFRYLHLIHVEDAGGSPEELVLTDRPLAAAIVLWGLFAIAILYLGRMARGSAPGKVILLGEHAVVYGRPALAAPVRQVRAVADVRRAADLDPPDIRVVAEDVHTDSWLSQMPDRDPLARILRITLAELQVGSLPTLVLRIRSSIPVAGGLGSGAAVSAAVIRALAGFFRRPIPLERQSALAYEVERIHHGDPSGIDNTVVVYDCPVYFLRGEGATPFRPGRPIHLVLGDSGVASPTAQAVGAVARLREENPSPVETAFDQIGGLVNRARVLLEGSGGREIGELMNANHDLLRGLGLSTPTLDRLVDAARWAGAWGAKLSGAGLGGNAVALVPARSSAAVARAMRKAGAVRTIRTTLNP